MDGQGNLKELRKSGTLKINGYSRQSSEKLYTLLGKDELSLEIV